MRVRAACEVDDVAAGRAERRFADEEARAKADAARKFVGFPFNVPTNPQKLTPTPCSTRQRFSLLSAFRHSRTTLQATTTPPLVLARF